MYVAEGGEQFRARCAFQKITARAGRERFEDVIRVFVHREHHKLRVGQLRLEAADAFDAADARQVDVHEDHGGFFRQQRGEGVFSVFMHAHAFETVLAANPIIQNSPGRRVVFHNRNCNAHLLEHSANIFEMIVVSFHDA